MLRKNLNEIKCLKIELKKKANQLRKMVKITIKRIGIKFNENKFSMMELKKNK
jgi:hypothetical protein